MKWSSRKLRMCIPLLETTTDGMAHLVTRRVYQQKLRTVLKAQLRRASQNEQRYWCEYDRCSHNDCTARVRHGAQLWLNQSVTVVATVQRVGTAHSHIASKTLRCVSLAKRCSRLTNNLTNRSDSEICNSGMQYVCFYFLSEPSNQRIVRLEPGFDFSFKIKKSQTA